MKDRPIVTKVEVHQFEVETRGTATEPISRTMIYEPSTVRTRKMYALRIFTDIGITGEYVGGSATEYSAFPYFIGSLIGRNALDRESIYNDAKLA